MDEYVDAQYTHDEHMGELSVQQQQQLLSATSTPSNPKKGRKKMVFGHVKARSGTGQGRAG